MLYSFCFSSIKNDSFKKMKTKRKGKGNRIKDKSSCMLAVCFSLFQENLSANAGKEIRYKTFGDLKNTTIARQFAVKPRSPVINV